MNTTANIKSAMMVCAAGMMLALTATAQTRAEREIEANPRLAAGKYMAYEAPQGRPTPPPEGYSPCYISTYARHGSRYLTGEDKYEPALTALAEADRMFANYPEIFADGTHVDARSTYKTRAFLSMAAACIELKGLNPRLNITTDASEHDAYYLKYKNPVYSDSCQQNADSAFAAARERFVRPDRLMRSLFADDYLAEIDDPQQLMVDLFEYHGISQSSYAQPDLGFLFTTEELFDLWQLNNFEWYYEQGPSPLSGGHMPRLARNLLRNIVETADTCLASGHPAATLRFGHDTNLAPLVALMQMETFDRPTADWDSIAEYYQTYRIIPMCGNVQLVFFRKAGSADILVKPLLNEREVRLANATTDVWPFYHWADLRRIWMHTVESITLPKKPEGMKTD